MPDWYPTVAAARYFGVGPWELLEHPEWIDIGIAADRAEGTSRKWHREHPGWG